MGRLKTNKGFTIVELLIVVVIIAILSVIAVISYNGITNRANDTATIANMKSMSGYVRTEKIKGISIPAYDLIAARTFNSSFGSAVYMFDNLTDYNDTSSTGYRVLSKQSALSQYGIQVGGRTGYIAAAVPSGNAGEYYLAAMAVGLFSSESSVPEAQRLMKFSDNVVPNVSGWHHLVGLNMGIAGNKVVCSNGSNPTSALGTTWASITTGQQPKLLIPQLNNSRIELAAREMSVRRADISCAGAGGGTGVLYGLVDNRTAISAGSGYLGMSPILDSIEPRTGN